jgi:hypothetical protein
MLHTVSITEIQTPGRLQRLRDRVVHAVMYTAKLRRSVGEESASRQLGRPRVDSNESTNKYRQTLLSSDLLRGRETFSSMVCVNYDVYVIEYVDCVIYS